MKALLDFTWESVELLESSEEPGAQAQGDRMAGHLEEAGGYSCLMDSADDLRLQDGVGIEVARDVDYRDGDRDGERRGWGRSGCDGRHWWQVLLMMGRSTWCK